MRIAIVDPYFAVGLGYQTTGWFEALVAKGHEVRAFATPYVSSVVRALYDKPFPTGLATVNGGEVLRLPARLLPRDMAYSRGLYPCVAEYQPDLVLLVYPGTMFARPVVLNRHKLAGVVVATFGENQAQRATVNRSLRGTLRRTLVDLAFFLIKRPFYRRVLEACDVALMQSPDTYDWILPRVAHGRRLERFQRKSVLSSLGFDSALLHHDPELRETTRRQLGVRADEVLCAYSCKITPIKRLDAWVSLMAAAIRRVPQMRAVLIGIREDHEPSRQVLHWIRNTGLESRFLCLPFAKRDELPGLYNAVDIGCWYLQPSVSIQEAMGTGVYMILTNARTVSHLVREPATGRYFPAGDYARAEELLVDTVRAFQDERRLGNPQARAERFRLNAERFSYQSLAERLLRAAADPEHAREHLQTEVDPRESADSSDTESD